MTLVPIRSLITHAGPALLLMAAAMSGVARGSAGSPPSASQMPVLTNVAGNWVGTASIAGCSQSGVVSVCERFQSGPTVPLVLRLVQGQTSSTVTGTGSLGDATLVISGAVIEQSLIQLDATETGGELSIFRWRSTLSDDALTGAFAINGQVGEWNEDDWFDLMGKSHVEFTTSARRTD